MSEIHVREMDSIGDVISVLSHPVIWDAITVDGMPSLADFNWSPYEGWLNVVGYVDGMPIAVMTYHELLDGHEIHIHVLPEYRKSHAREFAAKALEWASYPLYAEIPDVFPNVQAFAEGFGFAPIAKISPPHTRGGNHYLVTRYERRL